MAYYYKEYKIHTDEGMHDFVESCKGLFGDSIDMIWDHVCNTTVIKKTRPEIDGTLTERTLYNSGDFIVYPMEKQSYVFHEFTISLSNPNYIPCKGPAYFKHDSKPCTAIVIYEDGDLISNLKLKAKEKPKSWLGQFIGEFKNTFT